MDEIKNQLEDLNSWMEEIDDTLCGISESLQALVKVMNLIYQDI